MAPVSLTKRKFSAVSLGAFAIILTNIWTYAAQTLSTGFYGGGIVVLIYGSLAVGFALSLLTLSLAEFASAHPSTSGCTHIATKLGGPKWGHLCGYYTGGFHAFASLLTPAALLVALCELVATSANIVHPDWTPARWQLFLIYQVGNLLLFLGIVLGSRILDLLSKIGVALLFITLFVVIGLLVGLPRSTQSHEFVWKTVQNSTGWSRGMGILIGVSGPAYAYSAVHWLLNMADQVENPRRSIPIALAIQQVGNISILFAFYVAAGYGVNDWNALTESAYPSVAGALFQQAIGSRYGTMAVLVAIIVPGSVSILSYTRAAATLIHGFAETGARKLIHPKLSLIGKSKRTDTTAVPFRSWLVQFNASLQIPFNIILVMTAVNFLMGLIYLASSSGLIILVGTATLLFFLGYYPVLLPYVLTLGEHLGTDGYFQIPRPLSLAVACINVLFLTMLCIVFCLPPFNPLTSEGMNWNFAFGIGVGSILTISWMLHGRNSYSLGPTGVVGGVNSADSDLDIEVGPVSNETIAGRKG